MDTMILLVEWCRYHQITAGREECGFCLSEHGEATMKNILAAMAAEQQSLQKALEQAKMGRTSFDKERDFLFVTTEIGRT